MKCFILVPIITAIAIFFLQGIWLNNTWKDYRKTVVAKIEQALSVSIGTEVVMRAAKVPSSSSRLTVIHTEVDSMEPEERDKLGGTLIDLDELRMKHIGENINDVISQFEQDDLIERGVYVNITVLDSIFQKELDYIHYGGMYRLRLFDHDTTAIQTAGTLSASHSHETSKTRLFPIGTRGLQFVDAEVDIHLSLFMKQMLYLLLLSGMLAVVVMGCVVYLLVTIRRKNRLFRQREASVNGTVHDLKAPLNSIVALMGLLKRHVTAETDRALIEKTSAQARSLVGEIEELLITARRDRQRLYIQKKEVDLLALIRTACASVEAQYEAKPHHICIEAETASVSLYADGLYVTNVIRNLIENALKYSDDGVEVRIRAVSGKDFTELVVEDTGWGIDRRYQKKVFTQFFQVPHREEAARRGYGVGLAYVKYIMEAHGGSIRLESTPGKGSRFVCRFPNAAAY